MSETITQIGMGGVLALLVIREVLTFIKNGKMSKQGNGVVTQKEFAEHKKAAQYRDNCEQIVKRIDGRFDDLEKRDDERSKHQEQRFNGLDKTLVEVKTMVASLK